jgi:hypothetical protein
MYVNIGDSGCRWIEKTVFIVVIIAAFPALIENPAACRADGGDVTSGGVVEDCFAAGGVSADSIFTASGDDIRW